ncbi:cAMP-independent regulatory protein [Sparassis crispa]|uniref:cAMP-independent regulatory protein n=1 Tax=Sparassis crispa TaxID=139825 RepID=A0A401GEC2_9APHY|nr:cAMP-independent regulatory protein [Sparassis crispa]GBE80481.1 cAMP-independent regulatory protein [Sparassis crispa]
MQEPTLTDIHIRSVQDAHKLFYAVQLGLLEKIDKRLDANERNALRPGNVYVWEEKGPTADTFSVSMERFTEGKSWTASRVRDDFLMYFEDQKKKGRGDSQRAKSSENQVVRPGESDQFIKLTYSVFRDDPADLGQSDEKQRKPRKWHLNAYFTKLTEGQLRTIDDIPFLRDLQVPEGTFKSARANKSGKNRDASKSTNSSVKRTFAPFPSNFPAHRTQDIPSGRAPLPTAPQPTMLSPDQIPIGIMPLALPLSQQEHILQSLPQTGSSSLIPIDGSSYIPHAIAAYMTAPFVSEPALDASCIPPSRHSSDMSMSPSLSDFSNGSWPSPSPSHRMSDSPSHSASPDSPMADIFAPLTDNGLPYEPAPVSEQDGGQAGGARVDLAPLNSLHRSHPYRRSPIDDRALRLLGPGAR